MVRSTARRSAAVFVTALALLAAPASAAAANATPGWEAALEESWFAQIGGFHTFAVIVALLAAFYAWRMRSRVGNLLKPLFTYSFAGLIALSLSHFFEVLTMLGVLAWDEFTVEFFEHTFIAAGVALIAYALYKTHQGFPKD